MVVSELSLLYGLQEHSEACLLPTLGLYRQRCQMNQSNHDDGVE